MNRHKFLRLKSPLFPMILWWIMGLFLGFLLPFGLDISLFSWMRLTFLHQVSIVWLALTALVPFFISAFAATIDQYFIVSILLFLRGALLGFSHGALLVSFQSGAWLVGFLSLLPDQLCCLTLLMYALRWRRCGCVYLGDLVLGCGLLLLTFGLEMWILSPLRMAILNV